ncbi:flagellar filament capping protein FliD [Nocardioides sp. GCM10027113]|uniref:flagellar filament capping protein FliD n=1 Tax=unclassified Nocardioides TaxID=2615069 RepID=UPI00360AF8F7
MSGSASISGLASGLDTAGIISQLMQLEAIPQNRLKQRVTAQESEVKLLQALNTKLAALATRAAELTKTTAWTPVTATSSDEGVTVTAAAGAATGTLSFTVDQTALAHRLTFASPAAMTDVVVPPDADGKRTVTLTVAGEATTIDTGDGTLASLVSTLNAGGTGVSATALKLDDGTHRLSVQSSTTGAANTVTLTAADGSDLLGGTTVVNGRDAAITVGRDQIHSATNSFADLVAGVTVTVSTAAVGKTVDVTTARDTAAAGKAVKELVDQVNAAIADIDAHTKYDAATKKAGALAGESAVRDLRTALLDAVYPTDGSSLAGIGIQTDRYGKLVLDEAAFDKAYAADPTVVTGQLTAFAGRVESEAKGASDKVDGTLTTAINGRNDGIRRLNDSIEAWDDRLALRRTTLTRQFTALETALSQMNSQSAWLAGQIKSLPQMNTGS